MKLRPLADRVVLVQNAAEERTSSGIFLTAHDDITAVSKVVESLGYDLSEEDTAKVYEAFKTIAGKKKATK